MRVELLVDTNAVGTLRGVTKEFVKSGAAADKLVRKFRTIKMPKLSLPSGVASAFTDLARGAARWGGALATSFITINDNIEQLQIMMNTATGSLEGGAKAMEDILNFSTKVPFSVDSLADSFVKLTVSGLKPMQGTMQILTDSVAAFGGNSDQFKLVTIAIQQMVGKGVISMEELRRQLGEQIPTAMRAMARGLGMSMFDMVDLIKTGTLEATGALNKMFAELEKLHTGAAEKRMESFSGAVTLLKTEWTRLMVYLGKSDGAFSSITKSVRALADALGRLRTTAAGQKILLDISSKISSVFNEFASNPQMITDWAANVAQSINMVLTPLGLLYDGFVQTTKWLDEVTQKTNRFMLSKTGVALDMVDTDTYPKVRAQLIELTELQKKLEKHNSLFFKVELPEEEVISIKQQISDIVNNINNTIVLGVDTEEMARQLAKLTLPELAKNPVTETIKELGAALATYDTGSQALVQKYEKLADELKTVDDKILSDRQNLNDQLRELSQEGMTPEEIWDDDISAIEKYRQMALDAFQAVNAASNEGERAQHMEAYVGYLEKAKELIEGLDTKAVTRPFEKSDADNARKVWEYQQKITRNGQMAWGTAAKPYEDARKNYEKMLEAQKAGVVEIASADEQRAEKMSLLKKVGEELIGIDEKQKAKLQENMDAVKTTMGDYAQKVQDLSQQVGLLIDDENNVGGVWTEIGGEWVRVAAEMQESVADLGQEVRDVLEEYKSLKNAQSATKLSSPGEARAYGGPVSAGIPYTVGEYGKEQFIPSTNGVIVPHNDVMKNNSKENSSSTSVNFKFNGKSVGTLSGSRQSVSAILNKFSDMQRAIS